MEAKERLYLTGDQKDLVREGDPKGATLYAAPGDEIPESAVERFGLVDGTVGAKRRPGGSDKTRKGGDDKSPDGSDTPQKGGGETGDKTGAAADAGAKKAGLTIKKQTKA